MIVLLSVFAGVLLGGVCCSLLLPCLRAWGPRNLWEILHVAISFAAVSLVYVVLYSGLEEDSPSCTLVKFVALSREKGRVRADFAEIITDDLIVHSRLRALVDAGMVIRDGDRFRISARGAFLARVFCFARRLLRIREGG